MCTHHAGIRRIEGLTDCLLIC